MFVSGLAERTRITRSEFVKVILTLLFYFLPYICIYICEGDIDTLALSFYFLSYINIYMYIYIFVKYIFVKVVLVHLFYFGECGIEIGTRMLLDHMRPVSCLNTYRACLEIRS